MSRLECPVCSGPAHTVLDSSEGEIHCICDECGEFTLSEASSMSLPRYTGRLRKGLLSAAVARAQPGELPFISHTD